MQAPEAKEHLVVNAPAWSGDPQGGSYSRLPRGGDYLGSPAYYPLSQWHDDNHKSASLGDHAENSGQWSASARWPSDPQPPGEWSDEGWNPPTHITSASAASPTGATSAMWGPRAASSHDITKDPSPDERAATSSGSAAVSRSAARAAARATQERGVPGWQAVLVLIVIAGLGGAIDLLRGSSVRGGFNIALIVGAVVAIVIVRRSQMFPVLVAPPLVYFVASAGLLYIRSSGLHDRSRMLDAAINWLVYGFPAIAGASAAVLIIGGARLLLRR